MNEQLIAADLTPYGLRLVRNDALLGCPTWCTRQHHPDEPDPAGCHSRTVLDTASVGVALELDAGALVVFVEVTAGALTADQSLELAGALIEAVRLVGASS